MMAMLCCVDWLQIVEIETEAGRQAGRERERERDGSFVVVVGLVL